MNSPPSTNMQIRFKHAMADNYDYAIDINEKLKNEIISLGIENEQIRTNNIDILSQLIEAYFEIANLEIKLAELYMLIAPHHVPETLCSAQITVHEDDSIGHCVCSNCGASIRYFDKYCSHCGGKIISTEVKVHLLSTEGESHES